MLRIANPNQTTVNRSIAALTRIRHLRKPLQLVALGLLAAGMTWIWLLPQIGANKQLPKYLISN
ncbi:MAG: hypothetical protein BRC36_02820 [Cyanobacteria bacterium QH_2_48_84]|nr:MAG: hypothetical protein BRC36_02820 [Cyanobacteria bacterium QH_2_48_84]